MSAKYQVELVWNREFHFVPYGDPKANLDDAIKYAKELEASGDGERVKKTRIVDIDADHEIVWQYGAKVKKPKPKT
jgi:hypothetical protein